MTQGSRPNRSALTSVGSVLVLSTSLISACVEQGSSTPMDHSLGPVAGAAEMTFSFAADNFAGGGVHAAEAHFTFNDVANTLSIRLVNAMPDSAGANGAESRMLTGLFFNVSGVAVDMDNRSGDTNAFGYTTATAGTQVGDPAGADPVDYWAFRNDLAGEAAVPKRCRPL